MDKGGGTFLRVKCGNKEAEFYPQKCKKAGKSIANCIKYNARWINPLEFESLAGLHGRKWRENIKYEGKPIGKWLSEQDCDPSSQKAVVGNSEFSPPSTALQGVNVENADKVPPDMDESRTFDTSLAALTSDDTGGDNLNTTVSTIGSANRRDSPEHLNISEELESQLAATVKGIVEQVISNLKENMQKEVQALKCTIVTLTRRLSDLEEKLYSANDTTGQSNQNEVPESNTFPVRENVDLNADKHQQKLQLLQSQVQSLTMQQKKIVKEKEREKRKCNVLLGNVEERRSESAVETVMRIFKDKLNIDLSPVNAMRLGKFKVGQKRLLLVKMRNFDEKLTLLKKGKLLSGSGLFLAEDMSKEERKIRKIQVSEMKKARCEGKKAFIRFLDGELIVDGKPHKVTPDCDPPSPGLPLVTGEISQQD